MKSNSSTRSFRKRIRELKKVTRRLDTKMEKLERLIVSLSNGVGGEKIVQRSKDRDLESL